MAEKLPAGWPRFESTPGVRTIRSMKTTQDIVDSIETRLRELNQEIQTLTAARSALDREDARRSAPGATPAAGPAAVAVAPPRPARRRSRRRLRGAPAAEVVPAGRLELLLSENGGLTTSVLAERTNGNRDQVLTLLRELEAAGRVRRTGQRRSTRWHAITDEDRIRERAAELARRRKRKA
jgi:hypothetical protein